jgi:hypothetical protein
MKNKKWLSNFWCDNYIDNNSGLCSLCGNTGVIDTTKSAVSPAGVHCGGKHFCICPNGIASKEMGARRRKHENNSSIRRNRSIPF